ncbi:hypothetical protein [Lysinibacillus sp. FSL K6-0102]|uniref:hypothetical protein n=1 Tax=Lysinibacillus sp. FSL K6-0102 TaxID=2975290 RepID=UPI0030F85489
MKYVTQLTHDQILEIVEIYSPNYLELNYKRLDHCIGVTLRDHEGIEENYTINDYDVNIIDWMGNEHSYLIRFREKMLDWFGFDYAKDYLLK